MLLFKNLPENSAMILVGPPLSGGRHVLYDYMLDGLEKNEPVLFISTDRSPEQIKKDLIKDKIFVTKYEENDFLKYIDCYSHQTEELLKDTDCIKRISGPLALNEISIALSEIEAEFFRKSKKHRIIFSSLSTVLMYSNPQMVGRFIQVLIAKIKKANGSVMFAMEEGMHDPKVIVTIEHLMDAIIHVKKEKDAIMIKADGIKGLGDWKVFK